MGGCSCSESSLGAAAPPPGGAKEKCWTMWAQSFWNIVFFFVNLRFYFYANFFEGLFS
jgi:hypothetical protein